MVIDGLMDSGSLLGYSLQFLIDFDELFVFFPLPDAVFAVVWIGLNLPDLLCDFFEGTGYYSDINKTIYTLCQINQPKTNMTKQSKVQCSTATMHRICYKKKKV